MVSEHALNSRSGFPEARLRIVSYELARHDRILPVLEVDVRHRDDVLMLIDTLLAQLEAGMLGE